jgi:glycosyltransferase involved in cell wall biosynthesis
VSGSTGLRAVVATHYWAPHVGGIESVAHQQVAHLASEGAGVEVHTTRLPRTAPAREQRSVPGGEGEVRVVRHGALDLLAGAFQVPVPLPSPSMARALGSAVRQADVVIAHGHSYPSSVLAARAAHRAGRPFILVQHSPWVAYPRPLELVEHAVDRSLGRAVIRTADHVVCVSEHTADYVRTIEPSARITVVYNGVDTGRFHPSSAPAPTPTSVPVAVPTPTVVLFVGRFVRRNGWQVLLDAWRDAALHGRAELHMIGSGPDEQRIRDIAGSLHNVRVLGHVSDDRLADHYRAARVVVVPSTAGEGFGLVAAEALACGTPVVASDQGGLAEVVRHGEDGLLVAPGDPFALACALQLLLEDPVLHAGFARAARTRDRSHARASEAFLNVVRVTIGLAGPRGSGGAPRAVGAT